MSNSPEKQKDSSANKQATTSQNILSQNEDYSNQVNEETDYLRNCFKKVNDGLGENYVSSKKLKFTEINKPIRKKMSILLTTIVSVLNMAFITSLYCYYVHDFTVSDKDIENKLFILMLYIFYVGFSFMLIDLRSYLNNPKTFESYKQTFQSMVQGHTFIKFWIECYHYVSQGKNKKKKVTHKAQNNFYFDQVRDNSGQIQNIQKSAEYVFFNYKSSFSFDDQYTSEKFRNEFNKFVRENISDKYQKYWHSLRINDFQKYVCYTKEPQLITMIPFYVALALGLALPFIMYFEMKVVRYEITLNKVLKSSQ